MLHFGVTIPANIPQRSEIPEGLMNYPVYVNVSEWPLSAYSDSDGSARSGHAHTHTHTHARTHTNFRVVTSWETETFMNSTGSISNLAQLRYVSLL